MRCWRCPAALSALGTENSPAAAMREVVASVQEGFKATIERVMDAELTLFLGSAAGRGNKRNGYVTRDFAFKGLGTVQAVGEPSAKEP